MYARTLKNQSYHCYVQSLNAIAASEEQSPSAAYYNSKPEPPEFLLYPGKKIINLLYENGFAMRCRGRTA